MNIDLIPAFRLPRSALAAVAAILATLGTSPGSSAAELTAPQLTDLARDPSLHISAKSCTVVGAGPAITVLAEEEGKTADQNLKIDALFLSKALIEAAPGQIRTVKIVFSQSGREGRYITIENKAIQDFGSGKLAPEKLLASLHFTAVGEERAPDVLPGPQYERRLLIWERIENLRKQRTGVGPYENIFHQIEDLAKANDAKQVAEKVNYLETKLSDQEELVRDAHKAQSGRGVPASTIVHQPAFSAPASKFEAPVNSPPIPPNANEIKRTFLENAQNYINDAESRDRTSAANLRVLKQDIDKKFAAHQDGAAFSEINTFAQAVTRVLGVPFGGGPGPGGGFGPGPNGGGPPNGPGGPPP